MTILHLVIQEILHRKTSFLIGLAAITAAAGVLVAEMTILEAHDIRTRAILAEKEEGIAEDMRRMEDEYRKIMKELGYNLLILPEGQRLDNFYDSGYASETMPEDSVTRLAAAEMVTIRHLLPSLEQKIRWPEQGNRTIVLVGVRGEAPFLNREEKEPMLLPVAPGEIVLGYELWNSLGLAPKDRVRLRGRSFTVAECHPQRGTKDDITAWVDLAAAQSMLGKPGLINAILALKCHCAGNHIDSIRTQVAGILPGVRVIELENNVLVRARARDQAKATADSTLAAEREYRAALRAQQERFAAWLAPAVILGAAALIGLLMLANVRERRAEIGILRAIGYSSRQVVTVFLAKAALLGTAGAVLGFISGFAVGLTAGEPSGINGMARELFDPRLFFLTLLAAPLLASTASWIPALLAARQDPAAILGRE